MNIKIFSVAVSLVFLVIGCDIDVNEPPLLIGNLTLTGEWHVTAIHNSSPQGPTSVPLDDEVISIIFDGTNTFTGTTSRNNFGGNFSVGRDILILSEFISTEVLETTYGGIFYDALRVGLNTETNVNEFIFSFENGNLILTYADTRFLVLEKQ